MKLVDFMGTTASSWNSLNFRTVGKVICIIYPGGQLANYETMADPHNVSIEGSGLGLGQARRVC